MLKEYLNQKIEDNKDEIEILKRDINEIQLKISENEKVVAVLKKEMSMNSDFFSPRTSRIKNKERLAQVLEKIEELKEKVSERKKTMETLQQKGREYSEMLEESQHVSEKRIGQKKEYEDLSGLASQDDNSIKKDDAIAVNPNITDNEEKDSEPRKINELAVNQLNDGMENVENNLNEDKTQNKEYNLKNQNVSRETFYGNIEDVKRERYQAGTRITNEIKNFQQKQQSIFSQELDEPDYIELKEKNDNLDNQPDEGKIDMEIKSGELIILESERKKEKEFLNEVYIKIERSLAMLNGNKNMCKKEMQQIRKMIFEYVKSIS